MPNRDLPARFRGPPQGGMDLWSQLNTLDKAALATMPIPGVGDVVGSVADAYAIGQDPSALNVTMGGIGALPLIPSVRILGKLKRSGRSRAVESGRVPTRARLPSAQTASIVAKMVGKAKRGDPLSEHDIEILKRMTVQDYHDLARRGDLPPRDRQILMDHVADQIMNRQLKETTERIQVDEDIDPSDLPLHMQRRLGFKDKPEDRLRLVEELTEEERRRESALQRWRGIPPKGSKPRGVDK